MYQTQIPVFRDVCPIMLTLQDDFLTIDWINEYPFPSIALNEIRTLLA